MNHAWIFPGLAQLDLSRLPALEQQLAARMALIGALYGGLLLLGLGVDAWLVVRMRGRWPWREAVSRLIWRPWSPADSRVIIAVLALAYVSAMAIFPLVPRLADRLGLSSSSALVLLQSLVFHWAGLACVVALLRSRAVPWRAAFGISSRRFGRDVGWGLLLLAGTMPALLLLTLLYHMVLQALGHEPTLQDVAFLISGETVVWMRAYFLLLAVFLAPLFEEVFFRGILLPMLARRIGVVAGMLVTSLIFAGIHGHLPSVVPLFVLSVALSLAYLLTGSLTTSIVMHSVFNALTVLLLMTL